MSTNINFNQLKNFITRELNIDKLDAKDAKKLGIDENKFLDVDTDLDEAIDADEILADTDLYAKFATLYTEQKEDKKVTKDKEQEKQEEKQVKGKNGAGV